MIGKKSNSPEAQMLENLLEEYELPLKVRKESWFGPFYFLIERVENANRAVGKRYRGTAVYDNYSSTTHEKFCLYGQNKSKRRSDKASIHTITGNEKVANPNGIDTNKSHYIARTTQLFVRRGNALLPATFDRFDRKNGRDVIYIICGGRKSFYAFPSTTYIFPNKDDGNIAVAKANRSSTGTQTSSTIVSAYNRRPAAHRPSKNNAIEVTYEKKYHASVNTKLLDDLVEPNQSLQRGHSAIRQVQDDYKESCIEARENDGFWDEHSFISLQIHSEDAQRSIDSATSTINRIESLRKKPYFARVDCGGSTDDLHTAYIGEQDISGYVTSWRDPEIGNAYYQSSILQSRNDIVIALKRLIEIENAQFVSFDDEINIYGTEANMTRGQVKEYAADDLLIKLLKLSRKDKSTHDIIRTIQSEQYDIITSDFAQDMIVNGCAGSGKTMIMYHRLSYIAYNYESITGEKFDPQTVYVITPSTYFDISNNSLLKKLSIETVNNAPLLKSVEGLIRRYCREKGVAPLFGLSSPTLSDANLSCNFFDRETFELFITEVNKIQIGSAQYSLYQTWVVEQINNMLEAERFATLSQDEIIHQGDKASLLLFSKDYYLHSCFDKEGKPGKDDKVNNGERIRRQIITISLENIQKALEQKRKSGGKKGGINKETFEKRKRLLDKYSKLLSIALATDTKYDAKGNVFTTFDDGFWPLLDKPTNFKKMLTLIVVEKILDCVFTVGRGDADYLLRCVYVGNGFIPLTHMKSGNCLLYYLAALTSKYGTVANEPSFIFIDEFQNYSLFELQCIRDCFKVPAINLYGDFDQRIEKKGALQDELDAFLSPVHYNINVNYRNAKQITEYINRVVHKNMHPIGVDGRVSEISLYDASFAIANRTAIIAKDVSSAKKLLTSTSGKILDEISAPGTIQENKIALIGVPDSKGLEFDTVYVLDSEMTENEKYVACTRALDNLIVISDDCVSVNMKQKKRKDAGRVSGNTMAGNEKYATTTRALDNSMGISGDYATINQERAKVEEFRSRKLCQHCGGKFKGVFRKTCSQCGKRKDY